MFGCWSVVEAGTCVSCGRRHHCECSVYAAHTDLNAIAVMVEPNTTLINNPMWNRSSGLRVCVCARTHASPTTCDSGT
jgi:hypothetical protein